ncbi:thiamine monophosphate kinase [Serratia ficaria]|uniref:sll0787 family AIR synthase-like protein n=1 Tax=Enterobacterales TaxID=91347 RepID=UPI000F7EC75F|nr:MULTISPECIES: sll0787 family AIR synthase-like protein [Enterobacterales]RSV87623.1 sll0787 family AIR synthase-like protein [Klebsiella aerogenes]CAI1808821.1 thiamine monophosphate kinase [Serratia ficaria]
MSEALSVLLATLRSSSGLNHKCDIQHVATALLEAWPLNAYPNGDDCAVLSTADGYSLLAIEGFINQFVEHDPWFAGWCGVMVNLSDIAAMGGRPQAIVNAIWSTDGEKAQRLLAGMVAASRAYQVPIVGGHTNLRSEHQQLAVAVLGQATQVLSSFNARSGLALVAAIDLRGRWRGPGFNWDAATEADTKLLRNALAILPLLAESGLVVAAKDISQAGLFGTLVMMLESAQVGVEIELSSIPKPAECEWLHWLQAFPSFGYLLAVEPQHIDAVLSMFQTCGIDAASVGHFNDSKRLDVSQEQECCCFWDLNIRPLTGIGY